ncbi:MAG TPA: serine/threonine-protein kinase [Kofleriaceae bacterium]|nr:serine/threonine-protein kinase [Kofleriaceae bacterium]
MTDPRSFGRYRVTGTLGTGAMGDVYAAVDDVLGREVAVKTLRGHRSALAARILDERFRIEARAVARLHHPGVVQVFDIDLAADPPYLVMERVAGPSLRERLAGGALAPDELRALGIQIARALAAAHAAGIVHRDVKPANILSAGAGTWKLADFGVAHVPDSSLTLTGQFVGSPAYAPPEALVRGQTDAAGDVYGLGATLYEAAVGRWPRAEAASGALLAPPPPLHGLAPGLPPEVAAAIDRAVALEPEHRPSAAELADALAGASSLIGAPPIEPVIDPVIDPPAARRGALRWKPWALGAAVAAVVAVIALWGPPAVTPRSAPAASEAPAAAPASRGDGDGDERGREIRVAPPAGMDGKQTRDWNKIVEELDRGHYDGARHKLREFEDRYGQTDATRALAPQLDQLGPDAPRGPAWSRGRGKKHH